MANPNADKAMEFYIFDKTTQLEVRTVQCHPSQLAGQIFTKDERARAGKAPANMKPKPFIPEDHIPAGHFIGGKL